jgi:hypothetical protein
VTAFSWAALSRRFWIGQAAIWGGLATFGFLAPASTRDWQDVVYQLLFSVLGLGLTTGLGVALLRRDPARCPPSVLWRWALVAIALTAVMAATGDGLLSMVLVSRALPSPSEAVLGFVSSMGSWAMFLALWLMGFTASQVFRISLRATDERQRLEFSVREAEARALRAQMDPHFLFNALNSVRALIGDDPDGARDMLTRYTEVLHYALTTGRAASVPLGDELRAVESYLELERWRYDDRMTVRINVPDAHYGVRVPPLLLQTLAENAVRHGIARIRSGGSVAIATEQREGSLILSVTNPAPLSLDDGRDRERGIGLANSRERLALLYGAAAALHIDRQADDQRTCERWTVRVTLPLTLPPRSAAVE